MRKPLVYLAGPISRPDPLINCRNGVILYRRMIVEGVVTPFLPHLSILVPLVCGGEGGAVDGQEFWLPYDFEILDSCDALYRMDGESAGADYEVNYVRNGRQGLGSIPVFTTLDGLYAWADQVRFANV